MRFSARAADRRQRPTPAAAAVAHWTEIDWEPFIGERRIDGRRMRYVDYGSGPALVLMHGMGASWQWWLENIPTLGEHHRVIAVDLPGFGDSEPLPAPAEMSTRAEAVNDLLEQLGVRSATIIGHSMGGLVALALATQHRELVRDVILVDAGGAPMTERRLKVILVVVRFSAALMGLRSVRNALATRRWVRRLMLWAAFRDPRAMSPELAGAAMPLLCASGVVEAVAASGRAVRSTVPEQIRCPVLLVWGEHDVMTPARNARDMHARLPDSQLLIFEGVGHTPPIERPDRFNEAVLAFTARPPGQR
jgi:pimeloyl-ACP methyl ester carboxylesterase